MSFEALVAEIRTLPVEQRKSLIHVIVNSSVEFEKPVSQTHSLLELEGLGAEIWQGVDPQKYVNQLRDEWDHRP